MITLQPVVLEGMGIRLEPMAESHADALAAAAGDGRLWELWYTAVPPVAEMAAYVRDALKGQRDGHMLPWVVRELAGGTIVGSTRYHDIVPAIDRVEIGYTFYAQSAGAPTSTRPASSCCCAMHSTRWAAKSSGCARTTSTSAPSARSRH